MLFGFNLFSKKTQTNPKAAISEIFSKDHCYWAKNTFIHEFFIVLNLKDHVYSCVKN